MSACGKKAALFSDLDEPQANEIIAVLSQNRVSAEKVTGHKGKWRVDVPESQFPEAIRIANASRFPRRKFQTMSEIYGEKGMVTTDREERIRYIYATSESLSETVNQITGVVSAKVHISDNDPEIRRGQAAAPISASVCIEASDPDRLKQQEAKIRQLIAGAVQGMQVESVSVVIFPAPNSTPQ